MKPFVRRTIVPLTIAALASAACTESGDPAPALPAESEPDLETSDTAGVPIVENARPPADSRLGWRIGTEPALSIGEIDGPDPYLLDISDVLRMPDGRIIVADRASGELRAFDTLGVHLATWGGSGEGPGEFVNLTHVDPWPGDSLVARWSQGNRLTVFDSQGNYGRVFPRRHRRPMGQRCHRRFRRHLRDPGLFDRRDAEAHRAEGTRSHPHDAGAPGRASRAPGGGIARAGTGREKA